MGEKKMELGDNKGVKNKKRKFVIIACIALVVLVAILTISLVYINRKKPLVGSALIDVGGHKVSVSASGEGKTPIVLINGFGQISERSWLMVKEDMSKLSKVITFDRPGLGKSEKVSGARTSDKKAEEMHAMLKKTAIKGPYILVAHSAGGFEARLFASKYPKEVAGIILLDATPEDYILNAEKYMSQNELTSMKAAKTPDGNFNDLVKSAEQVKAARSSMKNIPLIVIAGGKKPDPAMRENWLKMQKDVTALSSKSKFVLAENSDHWVMLDSYKDVIAAVKDMLNMVK